MPHGGSGTDLTRDLTADIRENNISKVKIPKRAFSIWFILYAASHQFSRSFFGRMMAINTQE
jgi:hypothetical protein